MFVKNMLYNVSYFNKEIEAEINSVVGNSFNLIERIKLRGIGSQRFIVQNANYELLSLLNSQSASNFCNIELRKRGLIIWFRVKLHNWVLVLPYHKMSVYKSGNLLTIFSERWKISLTAAHNTTIKMSFVKKIMNLKLFIEKD